MSAAPAAPAPAADAPVLEVAGLRAGGAAPLHFVLGFTQAICLRGPSGAGKSTVLAHLALARPSPPGTVRLRGACVSSWSEGHRTRTRGQCIGWLAQDDNLLPELDVAANVALPAVLAGAPRPEERVAAALAALDLTALARRPAGRLSYGEGIRVALARLWVQGPALVLLDEPTAGQDPERCARVLAAIHALRAAGSAVVVATHDAAVAAAIGPSSWLARADADQ